MSDEQPKSKGRTIYRRLSLDKTRAAAPASLKDKFRRLFASSEAEGGETSHIEQGFANAETEESHARNLSSPTAPDDSARTSSPTSPPTSRASSVADSDSNERRATSKLLTAPATAATRNETPAPKADELTLPRFAPAFPPLLICFAVLLLLVFNLGSFSVREMREVSSKTLDLQRQRGSQLTLLLSMRSALDNLNNEARMRSERAARGGIQPFFSTRLSNARGEAQALLETFGRTSYVNTEDGQIFKRELEEYISITEDERRYALEGFNAFSRVDNRLASFFAQETARQEDIINRTDALQSEAAARISRRRWFTFLFGALIAAISVWEVARRYRKLRESNEATRRARELNSQVLEGMNNAVATLDDQHRFRTINNSFRQLFPNAAVGATLGNNSASGNQALSTNGNYQTSAPERDEQSSILARVTAAPIERNEYRGRFVLHEKSAARSFDAYVAPLKIDDERGALLSFVDVTEAAEAEEKLRRRASLVAVGQASAQIAHEIKNPLGSIRLGVSLLRDSVKESDAVSIINLVERGITHLTKLTADVTQFSIQRELTILDADLNHIVNESLELVADKINEKHIKIEKRFAQSSLHGKVDADALRQVFVNLIANAIDASGESGVIYLTTTQIDSRARIEIRDEGSGIDEETLPRLFEPFFTTKKRGTGLGLAITKKIIEQHDGTISVESKAGEGTRFRVELPLSQA